MRWQTAFPTILAASALAVAGCSYGTSALSAAEDRGTNEAAAPGAIASFEEGRVSLQLNLAPSRLRESDSDVYRVLPQTFDVPALKSDSRIDAGTLVLEEPVIQEGSVVAYRVNPSVAVLPGNEVGVLARVRLYQPNTVQSYVTETVLTDDLGRFETWAVPGAGYRLEVVPFDPLLPIFTDEVGVTDPTAPIDRDLGPGVPVYGMVTSPSGPVAGARVQLVDAYGAASAVAVSNEYGVYQIRATKGVWTVVCSGRDDGLDPTLRYPDQTVGELGLNLDVHYPTDLDAAPVVRGQVQTVDGETISKPTVRLTAEALDGYAGLDASFTTEVYGASNGAFLSLVVPGTYTIDVLPPDEGGGDLSPRRLTGVRLDDGTALEAIQLEPLVEVVGEVVDPLGAAVGAARVVCEEVGFGGRTWEAFTGEAGRFALDLPRVRVSCEALPPGGRSQLARSFLSFDPAVEQSVAFHLSRGQFVAGTVLADDGNPEPTVVVEVRDQAGRILGTGLTGNEGQFEIAVDLSTVTP